MKLSFFQVLVVRSAVSSFSWDSQLQSSEVIGSRFAFFFFLSIIVSYLSRSSQSIVSQCPDTKQVGVKQVVPYWNGESAVCRFGKLYFTEQLACVQSRFITHGCLNWNDSSLSTCAFLVVSIDCHSKRGGDYIYLLVDFILFSFRSGAFSWACCIGRHLRVGFHYLLVIIDSFCLC